MPLFDKLLFFGGASNTKKAKALFFLGQRPSKELQYLTKPSIRAPPSVWAYDSSVIFDSRQGTAPKLWTPPCSKKKLELTLNNFKLTFHINETNVYQRNSIVFGQ